jgi:anaerobic selenocysteine-containing dehydrogenase
MNSTFANLEGHRRMESKTNHRLEMHAEDAAPRGIADGDPVKVWNDRGSIQLTVLLSEKVPPGVVAGRLDWNKLSPAGENINSLTSERVTDIGAGATFYSTLVEVAKA